MPVQILGGLDVLGERLTVEVLVDARAEESDERPWFGGGHVTDDPQDANTPPVVGCRR